MKANVDAKELRGAMKLMFKVIEKKSSIPVLGKVRLDFDSEAELLHLTATDLNIELKTSISAWNFEGDDASILIPTKRLDRFLAGSDGDVLVDISKPEAITFSIDSCLINIFAMCSVEDWPVKPPHVLPVKSLMTQEQVSEIFRYTSVAISMEKTRYYLNGTYMDEVDGKLCAVSTDGRRMVIYKSDADWKQSPGIWPKKATDIIRELVKRRGNEPVEISGSSDGILMSTLTVGSTTIRFSAIDGTYPDYTRIVPKEDVELKVTVNKTAISRLGGGDRCVTFDLDRGEVSCTIADGGEVRVPICPTMGDGLIGFNCDYLMDSLNLDEELSINGTGRGRGSAANPFIFSGQNEKVTFLLMSMRVMK